MIHKLYSIIIFLVVLIFAGGCKKYLEEKSNKSLVVISSLQDLQSLLDNSTKVNRNVASADEVSSDEYYLENSDYDALPIEQMRNMYTWQPVNLFYPFTNIANDWTQTYNTIYIANTVLDNMANVKRTNSNFQEWDAVKGQALFLRAHSYYRGASIWAKAYDENESPIDLGLPLRLSSDFNAKSFRSTVFDTYRQIINDLESSISLYTYLPIHPYRSGKAAAYGMLSKVYLSMRKYNLALKYADSCLQLNHDLVDFNTFNFVKDYPVPQFNKEVIYDSQFGGLGVSPIENYQAKIYISTYNTYDDNDLRKVVYFTLPIESSISFRGSYEGSSDIFNGISVGEILLNRAECYARNGEITSSMNDLNTLLRNRYKTGTFVPITATTTADALSNVLAHRQKELIMRGTRWMDIKRLNKEGYQLGLQRVVNGKIYTLPPNDLRFALPIPDDIINLSGIQQNPR